MILILFPKDCQKCVRREYGDQCIGEFVKYDWRVRRGQPECTNEPGTCERNLCECDLDFARKMPSQFEVFDVKYHLFWSPENWTPEEQCKKVIKFSDFTNFQIFFRILVWMNQNAVVHQKVHWLFSIPWTSNAVQIIQLSRMGCAKEVLWNNF